MAETSQTNTLQLVNELFDSAKQARQKYELRWYLIDNFYENNHFVKQLNQLGQLEPVKFPKGVQIRPIPRAKKQIKSMVNMAVANDPRWAAYPRREMYFDSEGNLIDEKQLEKFSIYMKRIGQWFSDMWSFLDMKDQIRKLVFRAFKYNVAYAEVGADEKGNIFIDTYEPYDVWHEAGISSLKETSYFIKGVSRTLQYVKTAKGSDSDFLYDPQKTALLKPETRLAISEWKNIRLQEQSKGIPKEIKDERIARVFLKEVWIKDGSKWKLITECQGHILREVDTDFDELPFVAYSPQEGELYQTSPFEDLIPLNKAVDIMAALVESYTRTTAIGRMLKPRLSKVSRFLNEQGEVVEYEGVNPPQWQNTPPLPGSVFNTIQMWVNFMDEIGAAVVSFGKVPKGIKAAQALESLKNAEFSNMGESIAQLEKTLEEIGEKILDFADKYFTEDPILIPHIDGNKPDVFKIVSSKSAHAITPADDIVPISSRYMVKVEIESGLSYTEEGKRDTYMALADKGYLPKEIVLEAFKFSNVGEIIEKLNKEKAEKVSIVQTPEFNALPPDKRLQILKDLGVEVGEAIPAKVPVAGILGGEIQAE